MPDQDARSAATPPEIVQVIGRWALLSDGRTVTAILPYNADWDAGRLNNDVARFQADPVQYLNTHPLLAEVAT